MHFVLGTNTFGTGDERVRPGDEHFSAGDERVENVRSSVSDTHTATSEFQTEFMSSGDDCYNHSLLSNLHLKRALSH